MQPPKHPLSPDFESDVQRIIVHDILAVALPLLAAASVVGLAAGVAAFSENPLRIVPAISGVVLCASAWALFRRGRPSLALQLLLAALVFGALFAMLFNGGLRAPAAALLLVLVSMAGWIYGRRAAGLAGLFATTVALGVAVLSTLGMLRTPAPPPPLVHAAFFSIYVWLVWIMTAIPQARLRATLHDAASRERALQEEQARREESALAFKAVFDQTAHLMALVSPTGVLLSINRAARSFLGPEAIVGRPIAQAPGWPEALRGRVGEAIALARTRQVQLEPVATQPFEFTFTPFLDPQGVLRYLIVEGRDLTHALAEQGRQNQARRLELVGQLAGGVAHDFNNVLAAVVASSEVLRAELEASGALRAEVVECLDTIRDVGMRASDLTRRLLTFGRRAPLEKRAQSMHVLIAATSRLLTRTLPANVKLHTALLAPRDTVEADSASVESILVNLAINARDAMPAGGTLTLSTECVSPSPPSPTEPAPAPFLRVEVRDTGTGVAPELLSRVFEPYFTTKPEGRGTGIGLASVFGAMRDHNGSVQVSSKVNEGTVFQLDFPLVVDVPGVVGAPPPGRSLAGLQALIVDDEPALLRLVALLLKRLGIESVCAADAEVALTLFQQSPERLDLAVLDIVLPGRRGTELAADLLAASPRLRVLLVSGFPMDADLSTLPRHRVALLAKPYSAEGLREALCRLLLPHP